MAKFITLIRWAVLSGPVVVQTVQRYGPMIKKLVDSNPDAISNLTGKLKSYQNAKAKKGLPGASDRLGVLRDQVAYLYASANSPEIAEQAVAWKSQLAKIEASLPLIEVMTPKEQRRKLKAINAKIDSISSDILAAVVEDDIQDAEVLDDDR
ncbi:hypothetical protein [Flaviflexus equikiangi]|uniref:Uncharacterized protein n=1 Tax=Flaviflexus equikiangi TaxID=2758573 RepID=A0ABS2TGS9_9ACTO|nr:hypothetical protein [Flaviflexus equikiangi]MBM9433318.1 hypothetical protein [Flaviflexus equikiangi]